MTQQTFDNQAKAKRYLVVLRDDKKSSIRKVEKELQVQLLPSTELNSQNRSFKIMSEDVGIFYKNLNIAVVDQVPVDTLRAAVADPSSPVIYWEEEREYRIADEMKLLAALKTMANDMQIKLEELEDLLKKPDEDDSGIWNNTTWGIRAINLPHSEYTGKKIKVCILDTGLYEAHPDFKDRVITGKSFIPNEPWNEDGNGHGTHCAGTAVGNSSSDGQRYGIANEAEIYIGKVLSNAGSGSTSGIVDAIDWALEKNCKVISMSLGSPVNVGENPSLIFERAGERAMAQGCLIIAAAGNDSSRPDFVRPVSSPANAKSIMAVAAINEACNVAWFSNAGLNTDTGGSIDICAPGVDIFSSYSKNAQGNELYKRLNGTSMAAPHIAGLAALYWEAFPEATASDIWLKLEKNARVLNHLERRDVGQGLGQAI